MGSVYVRGIVALTVEERALARAIATGRQQAKRARGRRVVRDRIHDRARGSYHADVLGACGEIVVCKHWSPDRSRPVQENFPELLVFSPEGDGVRTAAGGQDLRIGGFSVQVKTSNHVSSSSNLYFDPKALPDVDVYILVCRFRAYAAFQIAGWTTPAEFRSKAEPWHRDGSKLALHSRRLRNVRTWNPYESGTKVRV